jgi:hypothetical protein
LLVLLPLTPAGESPAAGVRVVVVGGECEGRGGWWRSASPSPSPGAGTGGVRGGLKVPAEGEGEIWTQSRPSESSFAGWICVGVCGEPGPPPLFAVVPAPMPVSVGVAVALPPPFKAVGLPAPMVGRGAGAAPTNA